jgi:hypothetical protein
MLQDERKATVDEAPMSAIERVQRELAETRTVLQGETAHLNQLQQALEQALTVARSVRLEALVELDRLAGELMDAARRDAAAIRAKAEEDARTLRAQAEEEIRQLRARAEQEIQAARAALEAEAAARRADLERRVRAAQAELERMQAAWATAAQALTEARQHLTGTLVAPAAPSAPSAEAAPASAAAGEEIPRVEAAAPETLAAAEAPAARPQETTEELEEPGAPIGPSAALGEAPPEAPPGSMLEQANRQLQAGDVAGALDTFRSIVDRSPDEVGQVISWLSLLLRDAAYRPHHEEIRLLLVDAYMVQGDYDRAMSLLHEPAG